MARSAIYPTLRCVTYEGGLLLAVEHGKGVVGGQRRGVLLSNHHLYHLPPTTNLSYA